MVWQGAIGRELYGLPVDERETRWDKPWSGDRLQDVVVPYPAALELWRAMAQRLLPSQAGRKRGRGRRPVLAPPDLQW